MLRYPPQPVSPIDGSLSKSSAEIFSWAFRCRRNTILFLLVGQITFSALLMRYSRTNHREDAGPKYRASVAVLATEMLKLPMCLALATFTLGSPRRLVTLLRSDLPTYSTLKCAIPAFAYTIQSNLIFVATANLETPTFQVTYQTKTLFTALFSLSLFALPLAAAAAVVQDGRHIARVGAFTGFDQIVWSVVLINGVGGLLVAATMKYADNIVKCFATALAIIFGTFLSVPIFGFEFSRAFLVGAGLTVFASTLYAWAPVYGSERGSDAKPGLEERSELLTHEHSPAIDPLSDGAELKCSAPAS